MGQTFNWNAVTRNTRKNLVGLVLGCICLRYKIGDEMIILNRFNFWVGLDNIGSIATCYGLDSPGIKSWWGARLCAPAHTLHEARLTSCPIVPHLFPSGRAARAWC